MATLINTYADNAVTELISEVLSQDLSSLNLDEIFNLLWDVIANIGNAEEEMSDVAIEAAKTIKDATEDPIEGIALVLGLAELLDKRVSSPLSDYVSGWWVSEAMESFGEGLSKLTLNEHSWILFCLLQDCVEMDNVDEEQFDEINNWLETNTDKTIEQSELIPVARAIAHIAVEQYYSDLAA